MGTDTAMPTKEKSMETTENTPTVFTFGTANLVAVTDETGQSWFRANEICEILGYANPRQAVKKNCKPKGVSTRDTLANHVDEDDVRSQDIIDSMGRNQVSNFVTEFGLHDVRVRGVTLQTPRY